MSFCGVLFFGFIFVFTIGDLSLECKSKLDSSCNVLGLCISQVSHIFLVFSWFTLDHLIWNVLILDQRLHHRAISLQKITKKLCYLTIWPYFYYFALKEYEEQPASNTENSGSETGSSTTNNTPVAYSEEYLQY